MNGQMIMAACKLSPEVLVMDQGTFFASILGTLNHLLVADTPDLASYERQRSLLYQAGVDVGGTDLRAVLPGVEV